MWLNIVKIYKLFEIINKEIIIIDCDEELTNKIRNKGFLTFNLNYSYIDLAIKINQYPAYCFYDSSVDKINKKQKKFLLQTLKKLNLDFKIEIDKVERIFVRGKG